MEAQRSSKDSYFNSRVEHPKQQPIARPSDKVVAQNSTSLRLTALVASNEGKDTNLVFSPLLLQVVLSLLAAGSSGPTRHQLMSFLGSKTVDDLNRAASELISVGLADGGGHGGPKLCFVNGVWVDQSIGVKEAFKINIADHVYKAIVQQVDFQTKAGEVDSEVNSWIERNTNGVIKELIPLGSVDSATRLILANALYFKGAWSSERLDSWKTTHNSNFYLVNGESVRTEFMTSRNDQFIRAYNGFKVLRLCYEQGSCDNDDTRQLSMYIFLPDAKNGLPWLLKKVSQEPGFLDRHVPQYEVRVGILQVPRFKFSFEFEASATLKQLGLTLPFYSLDLTEMVNSENITYNLYISNVFHSAYIEVVNEDRAGIEAAAGATAIKLMSSVDDVDVDHGVNFVADHPFMFFIREDVSGVLLLVGHVMNPEPTI